MNGTTIHNQEETTVAGQGIATASRQSEVLVHQHDALLDSILDGLCESPLTQINLFRVLEVMRMQSDVLHLLDQRIRLLEDAIESRTEVITTIG